MHTCNLIFKYFSDLNLTVERHFTAWAKITLFSPNIWK
jgi:hypothetical protein